MNIWRRGTKGLFINPKFQWSFISYVMVGVGINMAVIYGAIQYLYSQFQDEMIRNHLPQDSFIFVNLINQHKTINLVFLALTALSFAFFVVSGAVLSHRVAGPLHRMKNHMEQIAAGQNPAPLKFRKKDWFPELASHFNKARQAMTDKRAA